MGGTFHVSRTKTFARALFVGATGLALAELGVAGCSSTRPPPAGEAVPADGSVTRRDGAGGDATLVDAPDASADLDASVDPDAGAGGDADAGVKCLGEDLAPVDGGPTTITCPSGGTCASACARIVDHYKGGVAQAAVGCILALPSCTTPTDVIACVDKALLRACADPTSAGYCSPLVQACDPDAGDFGSSISQSGCESFANGLSSAGRQVFSTCLQDKISAGTCAAQNVECADAIRQ